MKTYRAWVNQPSKLQPLHGFHGKKCIVNDYGDTVVTVWFTEGEIHSMVVPRNCVSKLSL